MPRTTGLRRSVLRKEGRPRLKRLARVAIVLGSLAAVIVLVVWFRAPLLRNLGSLLVAEDPLAPADAIVLTMDVGGAGVLEASDLVRAGISKRVAVFAEPLDAVDLEFQRRGYKVQGNSAVWVRMLTSLGVPNVEQIPMQVNGTHAESEILPGWCDGNRLRAVVVVTSPDHSRRVRRSLQRTMKGRSTRVMVRPARFATFQSDRWWQSRDGLRIGLVELEKLLVDVVGHPVSR